MKAKVKVQPLNAPFPQFGGKRNFAKTIWARFGPVVRYVEPFAGSLAVLLRYPYEPLPKGGEVIADKSPYISNFWRSTKAEPEAVAFHADYPTVHQDLRARHKWLLEWARDNAQRLWDDADYHDPKAAGWWAWGMSSWVGGGFCMGDYDLTPPDKVPHLQDTPSGQGVQTQRLTLEPSDREPFMQTTTGGRGVSMQRLNLPDGRPFIQGHPGGAGVSAQRLDLELPDKVPHLDKNAGGQGVQMQRLTIGDTRPHVMSHPGGQGIQMLNQSLPDESGGLPLDGARLRPWMLELCHRLKRCVVLHRSWRSAVSNKMMMREKNANWIVGCFLDPPYRTGNRSKGIYQSDYDGESDDAATQAYAWAVENGNVERFRIAFACRHGDFPLPPGWSSSIRKFPGVKDPKRRERHKDEIMFSPHCLDAPP